MAHEVIRLLPRTDYDFSALTAGAAVLNLPIGSPDLDLEAWCNGTLIVRLHQASLPSGNTIRVDLKATAPTDEDPGKFFRGPLLATALASSSLTAPGVLRGALTGNAAMSGSLFLSAVCATAGTFTFTISVDLLVLSYADPWTPRQLGTSLTLWLDQRDQALVSGAVSAWGDESGSANSFSQSTAALRPAGGSSINQQPAPSFTLTNELDGPTAISGLVSATGYHVFAVINLVKTNGVNATVYLNDGVIADTGVGWWGLYAKHGATNELHGFHWDSTSRDVVVTSVPLQTDLLVEWSYDNANVRLRVGNGATQSVAATGSIGSLGNAARIGVGATGSTNFTGLVGSMLVFNRHLSEWEVQAVRAYLSSKYGVPA